MADGQKPSNTIHRRAEIIGVALLGAPRMDGDAHAEPTDRFEVFNDQITLRLEGSCYCFLRPVEGGAKRIAHGFEYETRMLLNSGTYQCIMPCDSIPHCCLVRFPPLRAALDVGEQEGHSASRQRR